MRETFASHGSNLSKAEPFRADPQLGGNRCGQALDESAERLGREAGREQVLRIKVSLGSSVLSIVSGPNPNANLLPSFSDLLRAKLI